MVNLTLRVLSRPEVITKSFAFDWNERKWMLLDLMVL
jgi:hypothetical protein